LIAHVQKKVLGFESRWWTPVFLAVDDLLSTFQGDDYVHPQNGCWTLYWQKNCIEKRMSANVKTSFAYHIHLCVQSTFFIACLYVPFFCSFLVVDSLQHISSSWFLSPYLGVIFTEKVFTISPIPGFLESLSMDISECSWEWNFFVFWWGNFPDSKQEHIEE
jgi:hypothetical protein